VSPVLKVVQLHFILVREVMNGPSVSLEGQIVYIRRCSAALSFVDVMCAGEKRVELIVKAARVPKLLKGDTVCFCLNRP
jgi:hypothetical protein